MFNSVLSKKLLKSITISTSFFCMFTVASSHVYGMDDMWRGNKTVDPFLPKLCLTKHALNSETPLSEEQLNQLLNHRVVLVFDSPVYSEDEKLATKYITDSFFHNPLKKPGEYITLISSSEDINVVHKYIKSRNILTSTHRKTDISTRWNGYVYYYNKIGEINEVAQDVLAVLKKENNELLSDSEST